MRGKPAPCAIAEPQRTDTRTPAIAAMDLRRFIIASKLAVSRLLWVAPANPPIGRAGSTRYSWEHSPRRPYVRRRTYGAESLWHARHGKATFGCDQFTTGLN